MRKFLSKATSDRMRKLGVTGSVAFLPTTGTQGQGGPESGPERPRIAGKGTLQAIGPADEERDSGGKWTSSDDPVEKLVKSGVSRDAANWLHSWTFKHDAGTLTPEIEKELSKYRMTGIHKLFRAELPGKGSWKKKRFSSWTYKRGLAEFIKESDPRYRVISRFAGPSDSLVDFTKLPNASDFLNEVIVKNPKISAGINATEWKDYLDYLKTKHGIGDDAWNPDLHPRNPQGEFAPGFGKMPPPPVGMHHHYKGMTQSGTEVHFKWSGKLYKSTTGSAYTPQQMQHAYDHGLVEHVHEKPSQPLFDKAPSSGKPAGQTPKFDPSQLKLKPNQPHLGGAHDKWVYTDPNGKDWLFKPATTLSGTPAKMMGYADEAVSRLQKEIRPDAAIKARAITLETPQGKQFGSIQRMVPNIASNHLSVNQLSPDDVKQLQQEHVVDWLVSNHDAHGGQFLKTASGRILGIDKGQAYKYFPKDALSPDYHPNAVYGEAPPIYNEIAQAAKQGKIQLDPNNALPAIRNAEDIPDYEFSKILTPYAMARTGAASPNDPEVQDFLRQVIARKDNLRDDFENYYSKVLGRPFKFPAGKDAPPPPKEITVDPSLPKLADVLP